MVFFCKYPLIFYLYKPVNKKKSEKLKNLFRQIGTLMKIEKQKCEILSNPTELNEFDI